MTDAKRIDIRSLVVGVLCAVIILLLIALSNAKQEVEAVAPPPQSPTPTGYIDRFQQARLAARTIERHIRSIFGEWFGNDRSLVHVHAVLNNDTSVQRQHIALGIDRTIPIQDPNIGEYVEESHAHEEIEPCDQMVREAAELGAERSDGITVFAVDFYKTQGIVARERTQAHARERFWTKEPLSAILPLILFHLLRWRVSRKLASDLAGFFARPDNRAAIMVSSGLFFCAGAPGYWEHLPNWNGLVAIPGACLLLVGLYWDWGIFAETHLAGRAP